MKRVDRIFSLFVVEETEINIRTTRVWVVVRTAAVVSPSKKRFLQTWKFINLEHFYTQNVPSPAAHHTIFKYKYVGRHL